jgi:hypothetical protein
MYVKPEDQMACCSKILKSLSDGKHTASPTEVLSIMKGLVESNHASQEAFTKALEESFGRGESGDYARAMASNVRDAIRRASVEDDFETFVRYLKLARQLPEFSSPPGQHRKSNRKPPAIERINKPALSADALLRLSSSPVSKGNFPLSYGDLLSPGGHGGLFCTEKSDSPSAEVVLRDQAVLHHITLVNGWDNPALLRAQGTFVVEVSADRNIWKEVFRGEATRPVYEISLADSPPTARHIRVTATPRKEGDLCTLMLRQFIVYGDPQY